MAFIIADRVKETSATTGSGALTLSGSMPGFQSFSAACSVGDTLYYALQAVDSSGVPTGEWECGLGTYSSANTLARTTVTSSSNAGAVVALSPGTKQVFISMPAAQVAWARERLTAPRTYYVRPDGSDSASGRVNSAGGAFLTIQKAVNVICRTLDMGEHQVTVQVSDGTYADAVVLGRYIGDMPPIIQGNASVPANVVISVTGATAITLAVPMTWSVQSLKVQAPTVGSGLYVAYSGVINFKAIVFGQCATAHILAADSATVIATGNYTITAGAAYHAMVINGGTISINGRTVTITGSPVFTAFAYLRTLATLSCSSATFTGAATGSRFSVNLNSVVFANAATLPGNTDGTIATGGQYA